MSLPERLGWLLLPVLGAIALFGPEQGWPGWMADLAAGLAFVIFVPLMVLRFRRIWRGLF